jgi:hypothetical protein
MKLCSVRSSFLSYLVFFALLELPVYLRFPYPCNASLVVHNFYLHRSS